MRFCTSCGTSNPIGTENCIKCGLPLIQKAKSSNDSSDNPSKEYAPNNPSENYPPQEGYSSPPQVVYVQSPPVYKHPAYLAVLSLFFPGLGLLFVPNRAGLGIGMMGGYVFLWLVALLLSAFYIGCCLMVFIPFFNFGAAIYSYDTGAKLTNGEFKPIIFK